MRKARNYKAEYQRRQQLARDRGFRTYGQQRHAIETGRARAIAPARVRTKRTLDAQQKYGIPAWMQKVNPLQARIDIAQAWSDKYSRSTETEFSELQARKDPDYLRLYLAAFVYSPKLAPWYKRLTPSEDLRKFFVEYMHIYESDEYESRYGAEWPHAGDYGRKARNERRRIERRRHTRKAYRVPTRRTS